MTHRDDPHLLRTLVDRSPDGLLAFDRCYRVVLWNETMQALSGLTAADALGKRIPDEIPFLRQIANESYLRETTSGKAAVEVSRVITPPGGGEAQAHEVHYAPWYADDGASVLGGLVTVRRQGRRLDARAGAPAAAPDERFEIMADCAPVMLWMSGLDARCIFFNRPWLTFTGRTLEQEYGYGWAEGVHPEDFQHCLDLFMRSFHARREFSMEYRLQRADGEYRWILDTGRPYWDASGAFAGFIGSCIDITDLKNARDVEVARARLETRVAERELAAAKLEAANKELEAFSYTVSHDLRAPLRSIDGFVNALCEDFESDLPAEARRYLHLVRESAHDMSHLIEDLLAFSRLGRQPLRRRALSPTDLARQVVGDLRDAQKGRHVELRVGPMPACQADPALLKQVYVNLIDNALKYTRRRDVARIEVGFLGTNGSGAYYVKDNGVGFDMRFADKLFGVFQRLHLAEDYEGTGVGLAIVQRIVQRHGGRVWADAAPGHGATFFFTLPPAPAEEAEVEHAAP